MSLPLPRILRAENDVFIVEDGHELIDLFSAHGTTWLGHCNPYVVDFVSEQLRQVWITGGLTTTVSARAASLVEEFFPANHRVAGFYSTGMEAAEFAIRLARNATGKKHVVGFDHNMHGKSAATAALGWDNNDALDLRWIHRLPFVHDHSEEVVLQRLEHVLRSGNVAAVFVEPIQGCGGGRMGSAKFCRGIAKMCREHEALLVFDEILTGFYRTGGPFFFSSLGVVPDVVLIGKAMGNGFPVSAVVARRDIAITPAMLPGSTFSGNPLALAAVSATLMRMKNMALPAMVAAIERVIRKTLAPLEEHRVAKVRGRGAMWVMDVGNANRAQRIAADAYRHGVMASFTGSLIRVLPAATIRLEKLEEACTILKTQLLANDD